MASPTEVAAQMIARLESGFQNEHHWLNWKKTYAKQIAALPIPLRNDVLAAWTNASTPEVSK